MQRSLRLGHHLTLLVLASEAALAARLLLRTPLAVVAQLRSGVVQRLHPHHRENLPLQPLQHRFPRS